MSKYLLKENTYKQMYLINKFEKNILENSLNKMSSGNPNLNENSKPSNSISQETQTNDVVENNILTKLKKGVRMHAKS